MPKRKRGGDRKAEIAEAQEAAARFVEKFAEDAARSGITREIFSRLVEEVFTEPHIAGITSTTPKVEFERREEDTAIFKVSISTTKTKKRFAVRVRL